MFKEMRRIKQLLSKEQTIEILNRCTAGVLGVIDENGYPYTVPVSYTFKDGELLFHSAIEGHKIQSIKNNDKVTFCVVDKDDVIAAEFTTKYSSVIAFGRARILEDDAQKARAMEAITQKYSPDHMKEGREEIESSMKRFCIVAISVEHMTGKASLSLINKE
ncbi:MAG: pyridoxamine 5'-phosphate oxidase family protein [Clostridia bacterium]|nr:pyridoxamine 5'-phosphate oxidase family protein [Clostridia bacterium]